MVLKKLLKLYTNKIKGPYGFLYLFDQNDDMIQHTTTSMLLLKHTNIHQKNNNNSQNSDNLINNFAENNPKLFIYVHMSLTMLSDIL